jgi:hypothetical protein
LPHLTSLEQLQEVVEEILSNPQIQGRLLGLINREFQLPWNLQVRVVNCGFQLKRPFIYNTGRLKVCWKHLDEASRSYFYDVGLIKDIQNLN